MVSFFSLPRRIGVALGLGAIGVWGTMMACSSSDSSGGGTTSPTGNGEALFRGLQDDLVKSCGGANGMCHVLGTYQNAPRWLGDPDPYQSALHYRGIIPATKDVTDSIILTQVAHEGPSLKDIQGPAPTLFERVGVWLQAEIPDPPLPNTGRLSVQAGFNNIPLDAVGPGLAGARLTFLAQDVNDVLTLSSLKIVAPPDANIHVDSPFFVILPRSGKVNANPDANGFKGELTVPAGTTGDLFTGKMILLRWDPTGQLKIVFDKIDSTPGTSTGDRTGCTALDVFNSSAVPAFNGQVNITDPYDGGGGTGEARSCLGCHASDDEADGGTYAAALGAFDLRMIGTDPQTACKNARAWINFDDKPNSLILQNPLGGPQNPKHPTQGVAADDPIVTGLQTWVNAETK
jgi:hypothetical protein